MSQTADRPTIAQVIERHRRAVLARDEQTARQLVQAWETASKRLEADTTALAETIAARREAGETIGPGALKRMERYKALRAQLDEEVRRLSVIAEGAIEAGQRDMARLGANQALQLTLAQMPPGVTEATLRQAGLTWNRLPIEAFESLVGALGDGSPLRELLDDLPTKTGALLEKRLTEGLALGRNPRVIAAGMRKAEGISLYRALTISRTEGLRAMRAGAVGTYRANPQLVKGFRRVAALSDRTCAACLALDGKEYALEDEANAEAHVNCRCSVVPIVPTWREMGFDLDEPVNDRPSGAEWLAQQPEKTQLTILGKERYRALKAEEAELGDFVQYTDDPKWGRSATVAGKEGWGKASAKVAASEPVVPSGVPAIEAELRERLSYLDPQYALGDDEQLAGQIRDVLVDFDERDMGLPSRITVGSEYFEGRVARGELDADSDVAAAFDFQTNTLHVNPNSSLNSPDRIAFYNRDGFMSTANPGHVIRHEIGHFAHYDNLSTFNRDERFVELKRSGLPADIAKLAGRDVSRYATESPQELVAEMFAGLVDGKTYPKELMDYYRRIGGRVPQ